MQKMAFMPLELKEATCQWQMKVSWSQHLAIQPINLTHFQVIMLECMGLIPLFPPNLYSYFLHTYQIISSALNKSFPPHLLRYFFYIYAVIGTTLTKLLPPNVPIFATIFAKLFSPHQVLSCRRIPFSYHIYHNIFTPVMVFHPYLHS